MLVGDYRSEPWGMGPWVHLCEHYVFIINLAINFPDLWIDNDLVQEENNAD